MINDVYIFTSSPLTIDDKSRLEIPPLSFLDLQILISPLVLSKSSWRRSKITFKTSCITLLRVGDKAYKITYENKCN